MPTTHAIGGPESKDCSFSSPMVMNTPDAFFKVGDSVAFPGTFAGSHAQCTFYYGDKAYATVSASMVSSSSVECTIPRRYEPRNGQIPLCAPVRARGRSPARANSRS